MANEQEKLLKNAQFRKALPMAFLNARNSAIEAVKFEGIPKPKKGTKKQTFMQAVKTRTTEFMKEFREFYAQEVATIGATSKIETPIERLKAATNLKDLLAVWVNLSSKQREDPEILKVAQEERVKYNDKA